MSLLHRQTNQKDQGRAWMAIVAKTAAPFGEQKVTGRRTRRGTTGLISVMFKTVHTRTRASAQSTTSTATSKQCIISKLVVKTTGTSAWSLAAQKSTSLGLVLIISGSMSSECIQIITSTRWCTGPSAGMKLIVPPRPTPARLGRCSSRSRRLGLLGPPIQRHDVTSSCLFRPLLALLSAPLRGRAGSQNIAAS